MKIEEVLGRYLGVYYFLILLVIGISFLLNQKKQNRISQTKVSRFYLIYVLISTFILLANLSFENVPTNSYNNADLVVFFVGLVDFLAGEYQYLSLLAILGGMLYKWTEKIKQKRLSQEQAITEQFNVFGESVKPIANTSKEKNNFLTKLFYNTDNSTNSFGTLVCKISQIIFITLSIIYLTIPIFSKFQIELLFSKVGLLLFLVTFMELFYSLQGEKIEEVKKNTDNEIVENRSLYLILKDLLKYNKKEILNEKAIGNSEISLNNNSALLCEIADESELKEINKKVMNSAFFENKKVLAVCLNEKTAQQYHSRLSHYNKEYDGKLIIKLLTSDDKLFDATVDIYVTAIENCFGNIKLLSEIDTVILEDYDEMLLNKLELIRAFGSIVKMGNPKLSYIILTYMLQGMEATVKSLLHVNDISCFCSVYKQKEKEMILQLWSKNDSIITERVLGQATQNLGSMIPLSLIGLKWNPTRLLLISKNEPLEFEIKELDTKRGLEKISLNGQELSLWNSKASIHSKEKYFTTKKYNWIITDDKNNVYEKIYKLSLINGLKNNLNIVSEQYLLRDYMISTYEKNRTRLKYFLPYVPYEVNSGKVVLYNLLLQLTNFGVTEKLIANILSENGISLQIGKGNNIRLIADKINEFVKQEFNMSVDLYSYITVREIEEKFIFDITKRKYIEEEKIYFLDELALKLFPNEIFSRVSFVKNGFVLDIEKEYAYNFYQKYLPGQKHLLNGYVYEIKNVVETDDGINAIVEASTNYNNNTYRQDRKVEIKKEFVPKETKLNKYANVTMKYQMGKLDYQIRTDGYFEFKNGISKVPGEYRYVGLDSEVVEKTIRNHEKADAIKIEIVKNNLQKVIMPNENMQKASMKTKNVHNINMKKSLNNDTNENLGEKMAFLISEVLVSMLGENEKYVQVKSVKNRDQIDEIGDSWTSSIEVDNYKADVIEIYILEDTQIERGLIDMIYKNLDNIFNIIHEYLQWLFDPNQNYEEERYKFLTDVERTGTFLNTYKKVHNIIGDSIL